MQQKLHSLDHHFPASGCTASIDLAFIVDSSGSINEKDPNNWNTVLRFVERVVERFDNIGSDGVRVGLVVYSNNPEVSFFLNTHNNRQNTVNAIRNVPYIGGTTNTAGGLEFMNDRIFNGNNGDRPGVPNVAVLVTDGESNERERDTIPEASRAKGRGIRIISVGVSNQINMNELQAIATSNSDVLLADDFDRLVDSLDAVLLVVCPTQAPGKMLLLRNPPQWKLISFCPI